VTAGPDTKVPEGLDGGFAEMSGKTESMIQLGKNLGKEDAKPEIKVEGNKVDEVKPGVFGF
jgi:hypothetical protein